MNKTQYPEWVRQELKNLAQTVTPCLQCYTCASACPVFQVDSQKNPHRIIHRLANGNIDGILDEDDYWWCGCCYSCTTHCPQSVSPTHVLIHLKNLAFKLGKPVPKEVLKIGRTLWTGFPLTTKCRNQRNQMGLPEPNQPAANEIKTILEATGFKKRMNGTRRS